MSEARVAREAQIATEKRLKEDTAEKARLE